MDIQGYALTWNGTSWSAPLSVDPSALDSVSCPSSSFCAATDTQGYALTWNGTSWSAPAHMVLFGLDARSVSCPSASFCVAGDDGGYAVTWNGTSWSAPTHVDPYGYLAPVSCPSTSFCAAVDPFGYAFTATGSIATPAVSVTDNSQGTSPGGNLTFTVTVTGSGVTPTGTVTWTLTGPGSPACPDSTLSAGTAACTVSDAQAGGYTATADYSGDSNYGPASGTDTTAEVGAGGLDSAATQGGGSPDVLPTTCSCGQPVNTDTGEFWHTFTDLSVPGRGIALDLTRTYSSRSASVLGPLGYGWTDSYAMSLSFGASGDATVHEGNASAVTAAFTGSAYQFPSYVLATLVKNADGSYTFTRKDGSRYMFSSAGQLLKEVDRNGYVTTLGYNGARQLTSVTDPAARALTFAYGTNGLVSSVTDPLGRAVKFTYSASKDLTKATDARGDAWSFTYSSQHLLLSMTDPRGGKTASTYDGAGRVVSQSDPLGRTTTYAYSGAAGSGTGTATLTDPRGEVSRYQYSGNELTSVTDAVGTSGQGTWSYSYDPAVLGRTSVTNPDGHITTSAYDSAGNLLTTTDPLGDTTTYTYDSLNEVLTTTDPLGGITRDSYGANGNLLSVTGPLGDKTTYAYGVTARPGDVTSVTNPDGHVTTYTYDAYGDVASASISSSASVSDTTDYAYDKDGERTCAASPDAVAAGVKCPAAGTTTTAYDADGEVTSVTDPDGHVTKYSYDADGDRASVTSPAGQVTSYAFDADGEQVKVTQPGGSSQVTSYDGDGDVARQANAAGDATTYAYDALGLVTSATDALGHVTKYGYDPAGNRVTLTDAEGQVTTYAYDADGRLAGITYSDGTTPAVSYAYDADGRRTSMTDGTGTTAYVYDADSRLTGVSDGAGAAVSYGYDPAGLLTSLTYPNGHAVTRGYNGAGELTLVSDWLGNTSKFGYDHGGNLTSQAYPNGVSAVPAYDKAGQLTSVTDKKGPSTLASFSYARNSLGEVTADTEAGAVAGTQGYSYTQLSQLASDSAGKYGYNTAGGLTAQPGGEAQALNAAGELTSTAVPAPVKAPATAVAVVSASQVAKGASVTSPGLTTTAGGALIVAFISADGPVGKSQQVAGASGGGLAWKLVTRSDGQQGTAEAWQAYAARPLTAVKVTATLRYNGSDAAITVAAFSGARGAVGAHATASKASGAPSVSLTTTGTDSLAWAVGEDPSHATGRKPATGQALAYQELDAKGKATYWVQRTSAVAKAGTVVKAADTAPAADKWNLAAVEILAAVPVVRTSYSYNADGDLTSAGATSLGYNQAGELTGYGTTATYAYDGDGLRMSKAVGGATTAFAWDQSGGVPLLIAAGSTSYVYGPNGQPIEQVTGTTPSYLLADQSGSTRLITSATGAVNGTYTYGPYGTVARHAGTATTALQYDGQYTDAESGLQYLQARYYNPATGQFLTVDPFVSLTGQPYSYAGDDPLNEVDATGGIPQWLDTWALNNLQGGSWTAYRFLARDPLQTEWAETKSWASSLSCSAPSTSSSSSAASPAVTAASDYAADQAIGQFSWGEAVNNAHGAYDVGDDLSKGNLGSYVLDATALAAGSATGVPEAVAVAKGTGIDDWLNLEFGNWITHIQAATANRRTTPQQ